MTLNERCRIIDFVVAYSVNKLNTPIGEKLPRLGDAMFIWGGHNFKLRYDVDSQNPSVMLIHPDIGFCVISKDKEWFLNEMIQNIVEGSLLTWPSKLGYTEVAVPLLYKTRGNSVDETVGIMSRFSTSDQSFTVTDVVKLHVNGKAAYMLGIPRTGSVFACQLLSEGSVVMHYYDNISKKYYMAAQGEPTRESAGDILTLSEIEDFFPLLDPNFATVSVTLGGVTYSMEVCDNRVTITRDVPLCKRESVNVRAGQHLIPGMCQWLLYLTGICQQKYGMVPMDTFSYRSVNEVLNMLSKREYQSEYTTINYFGADARVRKLPLTGNLAVSLLFNETVEYYYYNGLSRQWWKGFCKAFFYNDKDVVFDKEDDLHRAFRVYCEQCDITGTADFFIQTLMQNKDLYSKVTEYISSITV